MTPAQLIEYVKRGGTGCPVCGPDAQIEGGSLTVDRGTCDQQIICLEKEGNGHVWFDIYTLTGAEELST